MVTLAFGTAMLFAQSGEAVAAVRPVKITLAQPKSVAAGSTYIISGRLLKTGSSNNKTVVVQTKTAGRWHTVASKGRQDDGAYRVKVTAPKAGTFALRTLVKRGSTILGTSPVKRITVLPAPTSRSSRTGISAPASSARGTSASNFMGAGGQCYRSSYDFNGDCYYDPYLYDTSGNGYADQNLVAINGVLIWVYDTNEDWAPDSYGGDSNGDYVPDFWLLDLNQDNVIEDLWYDPSVLRTVPHIPGGVSLTISHGNIPIDPPGMAAAVDGLLMPGAGTGDMHICTFLASAAMLGSDWRCVN